MLLRSMKVAKILGIDIEINITWIVIFVLVVFQLNNYFSTAFPLLAQPFLILLALVTAGLFFLSLLLHELAHSIIANRNNLTISKITLFIFGGIAQMENEPSDPRVELKMAAAGPLSSLGLALVFFVAGQLILISGLPQVISAPFLYLAPINLILALFNLIPGFPLDGGRILRASIWLRTGNAYRATSVAASIGEGFAYFLIMGGLFLGIAYRSVEAAWFILIGWFLQSAAQSSFRHSMLENKLRTVKVKDIMSSELHLVDAEITLDALVAEHFLKHKFSRFPVKSPKGIIGVITLRDVKEIPRQKWPSTTAGAIVKTIEKDQLIGADESVMKAVDKMARTHTSHFLVEAEGEIVGIVTRTDLIKIMQIRDELGIADK